MKIAGWIVTIFGGLALIGCMLNGSSAFGPLFWIGLGIFFLYRANKKIEEEKDLENWTKNKRQ